MFRYFPRVLAQDSTCIPLGEKLVATFPVPSNQHGQQAMAKIQVLMDVLSEQFYYFTATPFTQNDQSMAAEVLKVALILITVYQTPLFLKLAERAAQFGDRDLSLMKVSRFIKKHAWLFFATPGTEPNKELILKQILYHCRYEKRARKSYPQKLRSFG